MLIILEKSLFLINDLLHHPAMFPNSCPRVLTILLLLLVLLSITCCSPGHLVHDYFKCQSEYFKNTALRCKEDRRRREDEESRRNGQVANVPGVGQLVLLAVCASSKHWTRII